MLRFFAKYQKFILVVGGSLLMIVFLLPAGGEMFAPNPSQEAVGSVDGRDVTQIEVRQAEIELDLLRRINPQWDGLFQFHGVDGLAWVLLMHEARRHGVYAPYGRSEQAAQQMAEAMPGMAAMLRSVGGSEVTLARAMQHMEMFRVLQEMILGAQRPSEPRIAHFARDMRSEAAVRIVPVRAADHMDDVPEPTDAEVKEYFDKYKDQTAGLGEPYGFGYRQPNRFKIEYLTVPLKRVAATVSFDERAGQRYYLEHPSEFMPAPSLPDPKPEGPAFEINPKPTGEKPATEEKPAGDRPATPDKPVEPEQNEDEAPAADATKPAEGDAPVEPATPTTPDAPVTPATPATPPTPATPAERPDPFKPLPYRQVREKVIEKLTDQLARQKSERIVQFILAELTRANAAQSDKVTTTPEGYLEFAEGYTPLPLEQVQKDVQANPELGVLIDFERIEDGWLTTKDIDAMNGLGSASLSLRDQPIEVSQYIASAREFEASSASALTALRLQGRVHSRAVYDSLGNAYIFRLVEVSPAHVPTLDEPGIRDQVVADLKKLKAYQQLKDRADALAATARTEGLVKLGEQMKSTVVVIPAFTGADTIRAQFFGQIAPPNLPEVGESRPFVDAVFEIGTAVDAAGGVEAAPADVKVRAIPIDSKLLVAVTELTEYTPMDLSTYTRSKESFGQLMVATQTAEVVGPQARPMGLEAVIARTGFKRPKHWKADEDKSAAPAEPQDANRTPTGDVKPGGA